MTEAAMVLLATLHDHALWLAPGAAAAGVFLLVRAITGAVRTGRRARLLAVPLAPRQEVELGVTGRVVLALEGPIFTRVPRLAYGLVGPDGAELPRRRPLFPVASSGLTRGTLQLAVFRVATPGRHVFRIDGLGASPRERECLAVFERPHLAATAAWIVAIVLSSALVIGSAVTFGLRLSGDGERAAYGSPTSATTGK